jgi:predicted TIM-barrel fold metal-dependent hydrolase
MVSVDDHLIEPPDLWQRRLPAPLRAEGPRVVDVEEDSEFRLLDRRVVRIPAHSQVWVYEGSVYPNTGLSATAGTELARRNAEPTRFDQIRPGAYDPVARLADMDEDGVTVQLPFPTFAGFGGTRFLVAGQDRALARECVRAYNDFVLEEWWASAPDRYIPLMILPLWDVDECVREVHRCASRGARTVTFPDNPTPLDLPSFQSGEWDPLFSALEETEMPLCMHFGGSRVTPYVSPGAPMAVTPVLFGLTLIGSLTELVLAGTFRRHPRLRAVYSEGGIGWYPYVLQRIDQVWDHYRYYDVTPSIDATTRPSEVIREHVYGCFIDDPLGVRDRDIMGVDHLLWESDYPHPDSLWPHSRSNAEKVFADVPDDVVQAIVSDNARRLFRLAPA